MISATMIYRILAEHIRLDYRILWLTDRAVNTRYACQWDSRLIVPGDITHLGTAQSNMQSRPQHDMTEGIMTLAEDKRPKATLHIGLS